jgi:protoporphyrinogen/coproporphyrinogen III oxidase
VHGVYAADARRLSVRAAFPDLWGMEERGKGSVVRGFFSRQARASSENEADEYALGGVASRMEGVSVFSFRDGIGTLTTALQRYLETKSNVRIYTGVGANSLVPNTNSNFLEVHFCPDISLTYSIVSLKVVTTTGEVLKPTHIVSALPLPKLHTLLQPSTSLPHLNANSSSSVTVMNLVFPSTPERPIHPPGFGYLIPRPPTDYDTQHPGILGTIFDSCSTSAQDTVAQDRIVKLTVMLGGPHPLTPAHTAVPTVLRHLAHHLASPAQGQSPVDLPEPLLCRVHNHVDCIPTLSVGHVERMRELAAVLAGEPWCGRLEVVGAGVGGVSVGDCVRAGRRAGKDWV